MRLDCDPFYTPEIVRKAFSGADSLEVEIFRSSWEIGGFGGLCRHSDCEEGESTWQRRAEVRSGDKMI